MSWQEKIAPWLEENAPEKIFQGAPPLENKLEHTLHVAEIAKHIATEQVSMKCRIDYKLLQVCALYHDVGRATQYKLIGAFNDKIINHHILGLDNLDSFLSRNPDLIRNHMPREINALRACIYGHGDYARIKGFSLGEIQGLYVQIVSDADDIANAAGALEYLEQEMRDDVKGYNKNEPECIGKLNPVLLGYLERGEKFNKVTMCHSYADYFVFAATLATNSIAKYGRTAVKTMLKP